MVAVCVVWKTKCLFTVSSGSQWHLNKELDPGPSRILITEGKDSAGLAKTSVRLSDKVKFTSPQISVTSMTSTSKLDGNFRMFFLTVRR